jgi:hypothetical protein
MVGSHDLMPPDRDVKVFWSRLTTTIEDELCHAGRR